MDPYRRSTSRSTGHSTAGASRYSIIFNGHGVPIWWDHTPSLGDQGASEREHPLARRHLLPRQNGRPTASTGASSAPSMGLVSGANAHDLQLQGQANHLIGAYVRQGNVDTSAYGGSPQRHGHQHPAAGGESAGRNWFGTGEARTTSPGPRPGATGSGSLRSAPLRHPPLELDRAGGQLGDRLLQAPRRRLQDRQEHRKDRLEAGRHEDAQEADGGGRIRAPSPWAPNTTHACSPTGP